MEYDDNDVGNVSPEERAQRKRNRIFLVLALFLFLILLLAALFWFRSGALPSSATTNSSPGFVQTPGAAPSPSPLPKGLIVSFLDVGQGDCAFLQSPSGKTMLIDGGPENAFSTIDRFLVSHGVAGLDVVIATHLHTDHIGGLIQIVDAYPIGEFYYPPFDAENETYFSLRDALKESQAAAASPLAGADTRIPWDDAIEVRVLAPYDTVYSDFNDTSYILRVTYGNTSVLFAGDATALGEKLAMKAQPNHYFHADVLKIGHHGSSDSTSEKFLETVQPSIAVISVGKDNGYGLPDAELLERLSKQGIKVYRTDEDGTVTLLLDGTNVTVIEYP